MTRTGRLGAAIGAALVGGALILVYYAYEGAHFVSTDYASVVTPAADLSAPVAGTLTGWSAQPDGLVRQGEALGHVTEASGKTVAIRSPLGGHVTVSYGTAGETVSAGQVLGEVGALRRSVVVGEVPETLAVHLRTGQAVNIRLADDPTVLDGTLTRIGRATLVAAQNGPGPAPLTTANATEYVPITVSIPKGTTRIVSGMSAALEVHI